MAFLNWQTDFATGVPSMDRQHMKLVELINELHAAMSVGQGKEKVGKVLQSLVQYSKSHFAAEEALLSEHDYPELEEQRREHHELLKQVQRYLVQHQAGKIGLSLSLASFLSDWLTGHIQGADKKYGPYVQARKAA